MNNYEQLLNELLFGAKELINQTKNVNDKFDMTIKLAEQVRKAIKMNPVVQQEVVAPVVQQVATEKPYRSKSEYEAILGYPISSAAYEEYKDIQVRLANGEDLNLYIPDPDGLIPTPEEARVPLAVLENPIYKELLDKKEEEEVVEEEEQEIEVEVEVAEEEPEMVQEEAVQMEEITDDMIDTEVVKPQEMTVEEAVQKALEFEDGIEIDIDEDPSEELDEVIAEIDGEEMNIVDQYKLIKSLNKELEHEELVERAVDWVEFGINKETYDMLNFIEDDSAEMIQCKTYLAYYIDAMQVDGIVYYINYFASNVEEDEDGEEVYVGEELQLDFLNKENISAFLEYVQQNQ